MKYPGLLLLLVVSSLLHAEPQAAGTGLRAPASVDPLEGKRFTIDAMLWSRPRTGEGVSSMPPLRDAVQAMLNNPGSKLAIHYPGGDDGALWAQELFDWLVSLGVEPASMSLQPGSAFDDRIQLEVMKY